MNYLFGGSIEKKKRKAQGTAKVRFTDQADPSIVPPFVHTQDSQQRNSWPGFDGAGTDARASSTHRFPSFSAVSFEVANLAGNPVLGAGP
jgi:hypothetical protein